MIGSADLANWVRSLGITAAYFLKISPTTSKAMFRATRAAITASLLCDAIERLARYEKRQDIRPEARRRRAWSAGPPSGGRFDYAGLEPSCRQGYLGRDDHLVDRV
jgi:hypothetical protein